MIIVTARQSIRQYLGCAVLLPKLFVNILNPETGKPHQNPATLKTYTPNQVCYFSLWID